MPRTEGACQRFLCLAQENGLCDQAKRRRRLTGLIKQSWLESGCVYGYRKIHHDMLSLGEPCAQNTVAKLMNSAGLRAQVGYKRRPGKYGTKPAIVAANCLQQELNVDAPYTVWVTDITYIRTHEGWLYLAAVIDLYSRKVVGWSMHFTHADIFGFGRLVDGRMATQTDRDGRCAFRSRFAVYQP